jgi:hypothetical protein
VADQALTSPVEGVVHEPSPHAAGHHHGRPISWAAVAIIVVGFIVGGAALPSGPTWWLFWTGAGIVIIGSIVAAAGRIMDDWY